MPWSRRGILELGAAAVTGTIAYAYSPRFARLPSVYGQTAGRIVQVGIEQYPVDFENPIVPGEVDKDAIDNRYPPRIGRTSEGHLYAKRDSESTKLIADFPTSVSNPHGFSIDFAFDTEGGNSQALNAPGLYVLNLKSTSSGPPTEVPDVGGIPFYRDYHKGVDYDWRYFFASSPLNSKPHVQIKAEFKTNIVLRSDNQSREITFFSGESDANGVVEFPWGTKLRLIDQTVAEPLDILATAFSVGAAALAARKLSRRAFLGLRARI
jgi:hypothetical protein